MLAGSYELAADFGVHDDEHARAERPKVKVEDVTGIVLLPNVWEPIVCMSVGWKHTHTFTRDSEVAPDEGALARLRLVKCVSSGGDRAGRCILRRVLTRSLLSLRFFTKYLAP